jgi:hypothetical protein
MPKINPSLVKGEKVKKTLTPEHLEKLQKARQLYQTTRQEERLNKKLEKTKIEPDIIENTIKEQESKKELPPEVVPEVVEQKKPQESTQPTDDIDKKILKQLERLTAKKKPKKKIIIEESSSSTSSSEEDTVVVKRIRKTKIVEPVSEPIPIPPPVIREVRQPTVQDHFAFNKVFGFTNNGRLRQF